MEKKTIIFATQNKNKAREIQGLLPPYYEVKTLAEINCDDDIPEEEDTLMGNALQKARHVTKKYKVNCFADDTGLEIDHLNGAPGVKSARYAGPEKDDEKNIAKVLKQLGDSTDRAARFRTVIALIIDGKEFTFEGKVEGDIIHEKRGNQGFGYDPIFVPEKGEKTFAQMDKNEKNQSSHRSRAIQKLAAFLSQQ